LIKLLSGAAAFSLRDGLNRLKEGSPTPVTLQVGFIPAKKSGEYR
jgi:hypothetical protein